MIDRLAALIVDEGKWLTLSMGVALLSCAILLYRHRAIPARRRVTAAMSRFFGVTIGTMAFGHLLAVTTKWALGTLQGLLAAFYAIGVVLAVPSWMLIAHTCRLLASDTHRGRATIVLNAWLAITLLVLGPHNLPLAAPGFCNIGYQLHTRAAVGWAALGLAVVVNVGLFTASVVFLASGQSFEQFSGMR